MPTIEFFFQESLLSSPVQENKALEKEVILIADTSDDDDNEEELVIRRPKRVKRSSSLDLLQETKKQSPKPVSLPLPSDTEHVKDHLSETHWEGVWSPRKEPPNIEKALPSWAENAVLYAGLSLTLSLPTDLVLQPETVQEGHFILWKTRRAKDKSSSFLGISKGKPWLHFDLHEEKLPTVLSALSDCALNQLVVLQGSLGPHPTEGGLGQLFLHIYLTSKVLRTGGSFEPICRLVHLVQNWTLLNEPLEWVTEQDCSYMVPDAYPVSAKNPNIQPSDIRAKLLPYQTRAVAWMMERENVEFKSPESGTIQRIAAPRPMYHRSLRMADGRTYYIDPLTGFMTPGDPEARLLGGVLADEMGLGKTVMMLSLVLIHPCSYTSYPSLEEFETFHYSAADYTPLPKPLTPSAATLIITPATILYQWITEIKRHAPRLRYHIYNYRQRFEEITDLSDYDIVLTTYTDLNRELNVADPPPERSRRQKQQYERRMSVLASILWWRVIVDEAQMVESSSCRATIMARKIPRVHAWGVTGTPFRTNGLSDLRDLFRFVDVHCAFANNDTWNQLSMNRPLMLQVLKRLLHRNIKDKVGDEITLPPQDDTTIHLKFTGIEQHYYDEVMAKCVEDIRRRTEERATEMVLGKLPAQINAPMRSWLLQLRQICDHPQVGTHNQMILGGRLRTMHQVMKLMHRTSVTRCYSLERSIHLNRIYVGQLFEMEDKPDEAMKLYFQILSDIRRSLKQITEEFEEAQALRLEKEKKRALEHPASGDSAGSSHLNDKDENDEDILEHITIIRNRKSLWKELEHRVLFLIASCYHAQAFPIDEKTGERVKEPVDKELAEKEDDYYKYATDLRVELLTEERNHVDDLTTKLLVLGDTIAEDVRGGPRSAFSIYIPVAKFKGGILSAMVFEKLRHIGDKLNGQWNILDTWRYTIMEAVTKPLEDGDDSTDKPQGDEFQGGLKNQEEAFIYLNVYSELLLDRRALLTGDRVRVIHNHRREKHPLEVKLERMCAEFGHGDSINCLRAVMSELRAQQNRYRISEVELSMCDAALQLCAGHFELQMKVLQKLEQEKKQINDVFNARVAYYGQLQVFSDGVNVPPEPEEGIDVERQELLYLREQMEMDLRAEIGKKKYMWHLLENQQSEQDDAAVRDCGICTFAISEGVFAPCGHHFCKECLETWLVRRHACPLCKRSTHKDELISFSKKAQEFIQREKNRNGNEHKEFLDMLLAVDINGSFGTKLDTVIRHILHLKSEDPHIKILVFSQWEQVLEILKGGLEENEISTIKIDNSEKMRGQAAVQFLEDPDLTVFMLNAKSQSAGLTLVSATHVFIIEPVTSGLDKQAINRVHRIGQNKMTHVWRYVMEATVEERMAQLLSDNASSTADLAWIDEKASKSKSRKKDEQKVSEACLRWCLGLIPSSASQAVNRENANPEDICDGLSDDEYDVYLEGQEESGSVNSSMIKEDPILEIDVSSQVTLAEDDESRL